MGVWSDAYFKKLSRKVISPTLEPKAGLPLDKKLLEARYVVVTKMFPHTHELLCYERGDDPDNVFVVSLASIMIEPEMYNTWIPYDEEHVDSTTGKTAIEFLDPPIGVVISINGDHDNIGSVCLGFVHMPGEPDIFPIIGGYAVKFGNSLIEISNTDTIEIRATDVNITADNFTINGTEAVGPVGPKGDKGDPPTEAEIDEAAADYIEAHAADFKGDKGDKGDSGDPVSVLAAYPVGSIYMSVNNTNPGTLFGGTWSQIKDKFILSAGDTYTAGATGGEATHTLTAAEMPVHKHDVAVTSSGSGSIGSSGGGTSSTDGSHTHGVRYQSNVGGGTLARIYSGASPDGIFNSVIVADGDHTHTTPNHTHTTPNHTHTITENDKGSGNAHNNLPPYLVVYVWQRTA